MVSHTTSKKYLSWVTIKIVDLDLDKYSSNHSIISKSKWFVGSSKIKKSASEINTFARATLFFCPPDNCPIFKVESFNFKTDKI